MNAFDRPVPTLAQQTQYMADAVNEGGQAMSKIQIPESDWPMSDWAPEDITVAGVVAALEGCGDNDERAAVIDSEGRELRLLGVRVNGSRVEIVVDLDGAK